MPSDNAIRIKVAVAQIETEQFSRSGCHLSRSKPWRSAALQFAKVNEESQSGVRKL